MGFFGKGGALAKWSQAQLAADPLGMAGAAPFQTVGGALADAAGGAADLVNNFIANPITNAQRALTGYGYEFPTGVVQKAVKQPQAPAARGARLAMGLALGGEGDVGAALQEGQEFTRAIGGMLGKRGRAEIDAAKAKYAPASTKPVVTQAGELGHPIGGQDQMLVAHPPSSSNKGSYHDVSPQVPPHEVTATYAAGKPLGPLQTLTPEDLEGKDVISLYGDRSLAGGHLLGVNGTRFSDPVELQGGPDFGRWQEAHGSPAVWASMPSAVTNLQNTMRPSLDAGRDVVAAYTPMGPGALDQSTMMTDALTQGIKNSPILKKHIDAFDRGLRQVIPGIPSLRDPDAVADFLRNNPDPNRAMGDRLKFVDAINKKDPMAQGFPDVGAYRMALTDPNLLDVPAGATGYRMMGFGPETLDGMTATVPHGSYATQMPGTNLGQLNSLVPFDKVFADLIASRRAEGKPIDSDLRAFELGKPIQTMTPQIVDGLMDYQRRAGLLDAPRGDGIFPPAQPTGEQLGQQADELIRNLTWGETPQDRLIRSQNVLSRYGGDHPEALAANNGARADLGLPPADTSGSGGLPAPELTGDSFWQPEPKPGF